MEKRKLDSRNISKSALAKREMTYAKEHNVDLMTFDSEEELMKIKMLYASAR